MKERRKEDKEKIEKVKENRLGFARSAEKLELEEIGQRKFDSEEIFWLQNEIA